jgi:membrane associated rhomboid family serine protease
MQGVPETALRVAFARRDADEWVLVLAAEGVASRIRPQGDGFALCVPQALAERAAAALVRYEAENRPTAIRDGAQEPPSPTALHVALLAAAALLLFFGVVTGPRDPAVRWFARGSADAELILAGELWRCVTALTLHADAVHALSNALAGALFFTALFQQLGPGLGLAAMLLAGAAGNLANAALHGGGHVSVGASTAVFAAVGALAGLGVARRRRRERGRRLWAPFAAGLGLLAMLGTGEHTDVWAHGLGFVAGGGVGLGTALVLARRPRTPAQLLLAAGAVATLGVCWERALR